MFKFCHFGDQIQLNFNISLENKMYFSLGLLSLYNKVLNLLFYENRVNDDGLGHKKTHLIFYTPK